MRTFRAAVSALKGGTMGEVETAFEDIRELFVEGGASVDTRRPRRQRLLISAQRRRRGAALDERSGVERRDDHHFL
jgi:hypothetical protein